MIYCLVPRELISKIGDLDRVLAAPGDVRVLVDRRSGERRRRAERRRTGLAAVLLPERRRIRNRDGRRIGDRRALVSQVARPELSRRGRRCAEQLSFVQRLQAPPHHVEDLESARLVARFQGGDKGAFQSLYMQHFDRFHVYLQLTSPTSGSNGGGNGHEAEAASTTLQQVFLRSFDDLREFPFGATRVRAWLARSLVQPAPDAPEGLFAGPGLDFEDEDQTDVLNLRALRWMSDEDVLVLVRCLPVGQRRILLLRYLVGLHPSEVAAVTDDSVAAVRGLEECATRFLSARLAAIGRHSRQSGRHLMRARKRELYVLQRRRLVLSG
jgi:DNA-directed RNA polymerase specialized sigma24 family protein